MKDKHLTPLAIVAAAAILGISGYFAVGMWAPKPPTMITIDQYNFEEAITKEHKEYSARIAELNRELGSCQAKLPATAMPKATPIPCTYYTAGTCSSLSGDINTGAVRAIQ